MDPERSAVECRDPFLGFIDNNRSFASMRSQGAKVGQEQVGVSITSRTSEE